MAAVDRRAEAEGSRDPYVDAAGVLRNLLGLTDAAALEQAEADISFARAVELEMGALTGDYDLDHLCAVHRHLFGDVYDWAGELRTVDIARTQYFAHAAFLRRAGEAVFAALAEEHLLRQLDRDAFVARLAHYLGEVNALHPFREGNGRAQRAFFGQLARDAGYRIAWERLDPDANRRASEASLLGDLAPLERLLDDLVEVWPQRDCDAP
jgi:cell filamentation protein